MGRVMKGERWEADNADNDQPVNDQPDGDHLSDHGDASAAV